MSDMQSVSESSSSHPTVIRTGRGLSIAGTRVTLYSVLDYLHEGWPPHLIRDEFGLTDTQISEVMEYIETHREEVEAEYQLVLQQAEENRQYWEARKDECLSMHCGCFPEPGQDALYAKLKAAKAKPGKS